MQEERIEKHFFVQPGNTSGTRGTKFGIILQEREEELHVGFSFGGKKHHGKHVIHLMNEFGLTSREQAFAERHGVIEVTGTHTRNNTLVVHPNESGGKPDEITPQKLAKIALAYKIFRENGTRPENVVQSPSEIKIRGAPWVEVEIEKVRELSELTYRELFEKIAGK